MSDNIEVYAPAPPPVEAARRTIADALKRQGSRTSFCPAVGKNISYKDWLAVMLWDFVTEGKAHYMDGTPIVIEDYDDWLSTVKFVSSHLDGSANGSQTANINVFKVYAGIDPDQV